MPDTNVFSEIRKTEHGPAEPKVLAWANSVRASSLLIVDDVVARMSARCHVPDPRDIRDTPYRLPPPPCTTSPSSPETPETSPDSRPDSPWT